jgi:predicted transposase/invertase (TIGR01784 family)
LNGTEEELFQVTANNMGLLQEEKYMEIVTSWERKARQEGIQQGVQEAQETIAINLLRRGMGAEETREITGLSLERVQELQGRLSQDN